MERVRAWRPPVPGVAEVVRRLADPAMSLAAEESVHEAAALLESRLRRCDPSALPAKTEVADDARSYLDD